MEKKNDDIKEVQLSQNIGTSSVPSKKKCSAWLRGVSGLFQQLLQKSASFTENIWPTKSCFMWIHSGFKNACAPHMTHLVSFVPICCRDSSLSSSVCIGRMFFSSSSLLEGRLLSLMARESFLSTFWARVPKPKTPWSAWHLALIYQNGIIQMYVSIVSDFWIF